MEEKKTVIWHGGLDALLQSDQAAPANTSVEKDAQEPTRASVATRVVTLTLESLAGRPAFHQRNEAAGTRVMGGWEAGQLAANQTENTPATQEAQGTFLVTRVRPIESVLPELETRAVEKAVERAANSEATQRVVSARESEKSPVKTPFLVEWRGRLRALGAKGNLERTFLYGGGGSVMLIALLVRALGSFAVESTPPPVQQPVAVVQPAAVPPTSVQPAPATLPSTTVAPSARAAVDALARGDYAAAARLYQELARSVPAPSPYSEAARILARSAARDRQP